MPSPTSKQAPDHVHDLKENLKGIKLLERERGRLMNKLSKQGLSLTREALKRVFNACYPGIDLTVIDYKGAECAIPSTGDNLRVDFPVVQDTRFQVRDVLERSTGISINGFKVDGPVAGIHLQVRIPLATLSPNGVKKV